MIVVLRLSYSLPDPPQTHRITGFILCTRLVLMRAKVLDLLAVVFDLCEAEGGRTAFEEVAEGGELW